MNSKRILIIVAFVVAVAVIATALYFTRAPVPTPTVTATATNIYNVKTYGAYGDGVHNDEAAILKTVTTANGGVVYFPAGNYLVTKSFILPPAANVRGEGDQYSTAGAAKQSRLVVITKNADGTTSWSFRWILPIPITEPAPY